MDLRACGGSGESDTVEKLEAEACAVYYVCSSS